MWRNGVTTKGHFRVMEIVYISFVGDYMTVRVHQNSLNWKLSKGEFDET